MSSELIGTTHPPIRVPLQLYRVFPIHKQYYLSKLLFSPDLKNGAQRLLIGMEVHSAEDYDKHVASYQGRSFPDPILKFSVFDETPHKAPASITTEDTIVPTVVVNDTESAAHTTTSATASQGQFVALDDRSPTDIATRRNMLARLRSHSTRFAPFADSSNTESETLLSSFEQEAAQRAARPLPSVPQPQFEYSQSSGSSRSLPSDPPKTRLPSFLLQNRDSHHEFGTNGLGANESTLPKPVVVPPPPILTGFEPHVPVDSSEPRWPPWGPPKVAPPLIPPPPILYSSNSQSTLRTWRSSLTLDPNVEMRSPPKEHTVPHFAVPNVMAQHSSMPCQSAQAADASSQLTADSLARENKVLKEELLDSFQKEFSALKDVVLEMRENLDKVMKTTKPDTPHPPTTENEHSFPGSAQPYVAPVLPPHSSFVSPPSWSAPQSWSVDNFGSFISGQFIPPPPVIPCMPSTSAFNGLPKNFQPAPAETRHSSIRCDACRKKPITGVRFKCLDCYGGLHLLRCRYITHRLRRLRSLHGVFE